MSGFNFGDTSISSIVRESAKQLQNTIWYLEGEITSAAQGYGSAGFGSFLNLAQGIANYADDYTGSAVKVMNLTSNNGQSFHQDQLVYTGVPDSGATLSLLALGLFGLSAARRRFSRA